MTDSPVDVLRMALSRLDQTERSKIEREAVRSVEEFLKERRPASMSLIRELIDLTLVEELRFRPEIDGFREEFEAAFPRGVQPFTDLGNPRRFRPAPT